ncbi:MAG: hypothetical protein ACI9TY_000773 [Alphaproteobacteria bacterium]|jgi:hypothetical protein
MHHRNPLQVLISDMHLAGVTDVVSDTSFDFANDKIENPFKGMPAVQIPAQQTTPQKATSVEATITSITPQKDSMAKIEVSQSVKARSVDALLWSFGDKKAAIQVILSSTLDKGVHPLSEQAKILFIKMLAAIDIQEEDVLYLVLTGADKFSKTEKVLALESLENRGEGARSLFIGEEATQLAFSEGILKTRQKENTFAGKTCGVIMHPEGLLTQPLLKKIAWQDLLKFQSMMEAK